MTPRRPLVPLGYDDSLRELKARIRNAQPKAALAVNAELVLLYWRIGRDILERQAKEGWGTHVIDRLSADLRVAFPEMKGFSPRNLKYMRAFASAWSDEPIVQQLAARLPWFHHAALLDRVKDAATCRWYVQQAIEHGWSRNVLVAQIETGLHRRAGKALTNFKATLPLPQSDPGAGDTQGSVRLRFPHAGPRCARAGPRTRPPRTRARIVRIRSSFDATACPSSASDAMSSRRLPACARPASAAFASSRCASVVRRSTASSSFATV